MREGRAIWQSKVLMGCDQGHSLGPLVLGTSGKERVKNGDGDALSPCCEEAGS